MRRAPADARHRAARLSNRIRHLPPLVNPAALHRSTAVCACRAYNARKNAPMPSAVQPCTTNTSDCAYHGGSAPGTCSVTGSASRNTRPRSSSTHPARAPRNIARGRISSTPPTGAGSGVLQIILWYTRPPTVLVFSAAEYCASGLLWFGCPDQLSFSISFAYRILPVLMEEFQNILLSYRLRGNPPKKQGLIGKIRYLGYQVKLIIQAFYPLMLNTAKRSRTTVEALELKGYRYALKNPEVKKMRLAMLKVTRNDGIFIVISVIWAACSVAASAAIV